MASSMMSSPAVTTVNRGSMVAPFTGLKSMAGFPVRKTNYDITYHKQHWKITMHQHTMQIKVWPQIGKKFETLSYLPPLTREQLLKEDGWIPCLEFELEVN
uniref:Ribulose-1,5-bisphosphate carboxylase small subunit N-terminal domain-containing protein n=1 Tax=Glycine max TaxID=3847 RepID=A0A0R0F1D6_SOYBN